MNKIITLKDEEGRKLYPATVSDAVFVGKRRLTDILRESSGNMVEVLENGLFICDGNYNCIARFGDEGFESVSTSAGVTNTTVLDGTAVNTVGTYNRLIDSGVIASTVYTSFIYTGDLAAGGHTAVLNTEKPLFKDYFRFHCNVPAELKGVVFGDKSISVTFNVLSDCHDCTIRLDYCMATEETHDYVELKVKTASTDAAPSFPGCKYNKSFPLLFTTDDMAYTDFSYTWCLINGYMGGDKAAVKGEEVLNGGNGTDLFEVHAPLTFTDDTGGVRRYATTSAIWAAKIENGDVNKINHMDMKIMRRMGTTFAIHDVGEDYTLQDLLDSYYLEGKNVYDVLGVFPKVMVEPNGEKAYTYAAARSKDMVVALMQNGGNYTPDDGNTVHIGAYDTDVSKWTSGRDFTSFLRKPDGAIVRIFKDGATKEEFLSYVNNNEANHILAFGKHGFSPAYAGGFSEMAATHDDIWVCSVDEMWEYFHLVNNTVIDKVGHDGEYLVIGMYMPKYNKSLFRELTLNIPITDGTECLFSDNVITGGWRQNDGRFTVNFGLEERKYKDISDTIELVRKYPSNICIRRDAQYLIDMLVDGFNKDAFQGMLDSLPAE